MNSKAFGCMLAATFCLTPLFAQVVQPPLEVELPGGPGLPDEVGLKKIWGFSMGSASSDRFIALLLANPAARAGIARTASPDLRSSVASEGRLIEVLDLLPQAAKDDFILTLPETAWNVLTPETIGAVLARLSSRLEETVVASIPDFEWKKMSAADVNQLLYRSDGVNLSEAARQAAYVKWARLQNS